MAKIRPKKITIVGLLILIMAVAGIFYYKNDSKLKSVKVDDSEKYAEVKLKEDETCNAKIDALNLYLGITKQNKEDGTPTEYSLSCQPTAEAIKNITKSESIPVSFKIKNSNLVAKNGSGDFVCKKGGSEMLFTVTGSYKNLYLELIPQGDIEGSKKADGTYNKCTQGYVMLSIEENLGGLAGGKENNNPIKQQQIDLSSYNLYDEVTVDKDDPNENVDRIDKKRNTTELSRDYVQVNRYLPNDTADYSVYQDTSKSYTFNQYLETYKKLKATHPEKTYSAVLGENDNKVTDSNVSIVDGNNKKVSGKIQLHCNYSLSQYDIGEIKNNNFNDTYDLNDQNKLSHYYYDDYNEADPDKNTSFNTTYLYGIKTTTIKEPYVWHINTGSTTEGTKIGEASCKRICEEVVKVDYGPPVGVKAGMCFEYRVKASSIVQCRTEEEKTEPPEPPEVCLPKPTCWSTALKRRMQVAGPTEDFQACVNKCDGGKYTEKCSNKCYNQVYGKQDGKINNTQNINPTLLGTSLDTCTNGQYFRDENNAINWCDFPYQPRKAGTNWRLDSKYIGSLEGRNYLYARSAIYYGATGFTWPAISSAYQTTTNPSFRSSGAAGILRGYYNGDECHDSCSWVKSSCSTKSYLYFDYSYYNGLCGILGSVSSECYSQTASPLYKDLTNVKDSMFDTTYINDVYDLQEADVAYNTKKQIEVKKKCEAQATCNKTDSTYVIHFNYTVKGDSKVYTVPPYDTKKETLKNPGAENMSSKGKMLLSYGGCYADRQSTNRWYQAEWTFPGTWLSLKGDGVSFEDKTNDSSWAYQRGKVCVPTTISQTNEAWAERFYEATAALKNPEYTAEWKFSSEAQNKFSANPKKAYTYDGNKYEGYNIYAESKGFGHFDWDFSISCFWSYSKNNKTVKCIGDTCNENCGEKGIECTCEGKNCTDKNSDEGYTVRSFDSSDPVLDGVEKKVLEGDRAIPFNWSSGAKMSFMKAGGYDQDPEEYLNKIKGTDYFAEEPELEIELTSENIKEIRKYNKYHNTNGYDFEGKINSASKTGVTHYNSQFIYDSKYMKLGGKYGSNYKRYRGYNNSSYQ